MLDSTDYAGGECCLGWVTFAMTAESFQTFPRNLQTFGWSSVSDLKEQISTASKDKGFCL